MNSILGMIKDNIFICNNSNTYKYKKNVYKIAYDGNIYSSIIIKQELLSKGYYFETSLEEEIILKAFIEYGFEAYNKFSGHFVVVIWNETKKELTLMRDYYCIKSIYYKKINNGNIIFSNDLVELLNSSNNVISQNRFVNSYLINFSLQDGFVTDDIQETSNIMLYLDKNIKKIENKNYSEYGYIFDEVAQIIFSTLDEICIVKLEENDNEIDIVAEYILEKLERNKQVITKKFSKEKLEWFLTNMSLPFYNLAEYNLNFAINNIKHLGIVSLELSQIKRFYNVDYFCKNYDVILNLPKFNREKIFGLQEVCLSDNERRKCNCLDKEFIEEVFRDVVKQKNIPIEEMVTNYYMKVYLIRLNNWIKKYDIKII